MPEQRRRHIFLFADVTNPCLNQTQITQNYRRFLSPYADYCQRNIGIIALFRYAIRTNFRAITQLL